LFLSALTAAAAATETITVAEEEWDEESELAGPLADVSMSKD
jgi:hypothetical protein